MQALTIALLCLTAAISFCAETPVQMATLRWNGDGEFMSWRWEKLGEAFEDGAARFAADSRIVSPTECIICGCEGSRRWSGRLGGSRAGMGTDKRRTRLRVDSQARSSRGRRTPALMGTIVNGQSHAILPSAFLAASVHRCLSAAVAWFKRSQ